MVKNLLVNARDTVFFPGTRRSPGEENNNNSSIFTRKIPWTVEPGGATDLRVKELDVKHTHTHTHTHSVHISSHLTLHSSF